MKSRSTCETRISSLPRLEACKLLSQRPATRCVGFFIVLVLHFCLLPYAGAQAPPRVTNPPPGPCGLPSERSTITDQSTVKTFDLVSDCTFTYGAAQAQWIFWGSSHYTINGNGNTISGPGAHIEVSSTDFINFPSLTINDLTITGVDSSSANVVTAVSGAHLTLNNVIFEDNRAKTIIATFRDAITEGTNVQFINNLKRGAADQSGSAAIIVALYGNSPDYTNFTNTRLSLSNAVFRGNSSEGTHPVLASLGGTIELDGCFKFENNTNVDNTPALRYSALEPDLATFTVNSKCKSAPRPTPTPEPIRPRTQTCERLRSIIVILMGDSHANCLELDAGGVGIQSLVDAGFIGAVNIWGYLGTGVEACFEGDGWLIFLDSSVTPRRPLPYPKHKLEGKTCGHVSVPGSLVLMPWSALNLPELALTDCQVTTIDVLNLREIPAGAVLGLVPSETVLQAQRRIADWFQVDFSATVGWIHADYVRSVGECSL